MSAPRGPRLSALLVMLSLIAACVAAPASAQFLDDARRSLGFFPDPIERSPRLLGMGRLTLADGPNNHLDLWDFARNPIGVWESDTTSMIEVWPATESADAAEDLGPGSDLERQSLGAHGNGVSYEVFHHSPKGVAYGLYGRLRGLGVDRPYDQGIGLRQNVSSPSAVVLLSGPVPRYGGGRMRWSMRGTFAREVVDDYYHDIITNGAGSFVDLPGDRVKPPDFFTPDHYTVKTAGAGPALSYRFGPWLMAAAGVDFLTVDIDGDNTDQRHVAGTGERRPYRIGQGTLQGRIGRSFEWIADGHAWRASNEERWVFTLAAGIQQEPLSGRGFKLQRREEGSNLRTQARWTAGRFSLGGSLETRYGKLEITGPRPDDVTSFNYFLNTITYRVNTDSLVIPDSVRSDLGEQRDLVLAFGGTWRLPWRNGLVGAEYHWLRGNHSQLSSGVGPEERTWDIRAGLEVPLSTILKGRAGYVHRSQDYDRLTARNEYISNGLTTGFGIAPPGASWTLQAGYAFDWISPDFADPLRGRSGRQQLALDLRWNF
jgi:hypothetical protein